VTVVAVNANDASQYPADSFEAMVERARDKQFVFPYAHDPSQDVPRAYGATRTPEVFLLDGQRRVVYHGAIDDSTDPGAVDQTYLRDALDALLEGREAPQPDTRPVGCTIKWRR
jgi:Redoxin